MTNNQLTLQGNFDPNKLFQPIHKIKTDVKKMGKAELEKMAEMGPVPVEADVVKLKKRKKISSVKEKNN